MSLTIVSAKTEVKGREKEAYVKLNLGVYATGGFPFDTALVGVKNPRNVIVEPPSETYDGRYDYVNKKIVVRTSADGAEVADTTDLSAVKGVRVRVIGE
jgi:hypothetical protein